ncbi:META domain containing protein [Novymonas esmeraldas]|uniref:META domain containing protein n=1 Tax=Novymonas esmeraldas TaxID=1808958 RepID=A0AAW0EWC2_9TRYP
MPAVTSAAQLVGRYKLIKLNGGDPRTQSPVTLKIDADPSDPTRVRVTARVANTITGSAEVSDGKIRGRLTSTAMGGSPQLMAVEYVLVFGARDGLDVTQDGDVVRMSGGAGSLEWAVSAAAPFRA